MGNGLNAAMLLACAVSGVLCYLIARSRLGRRASFYLASLRVLLPAFYFAWFYNSQWTFLDDVSYFDMGRMLRLNGYNPLSVLLTHKGRDLLGAVSGGSHVLYAWWNLLAQSLFGSHYWAAVFLNVPLTFWCARVLYDLATDAGFDSAYARGLMVLCLLYWDVLAWSSLLNLKDILVLTLSVSLLRSLVRLAGRHSAAEYAQAFAYGFLLLAIRFYLVPLAVLAFGIWTLAVRREWKLVGAVAAFALAAWFFVPRILPAGLVTFDPAALLYGSARFLTTPAPWKLQPDTSFMLLPSIIHWLTLVPMVAGMYVLLRRGGPAALVVVYAFVLILFYAAVPLLQGPRQRLQLAFVLAWGIYEALRPAYKVLTCAA